MNTTVPQSVTTLFFRNRYLLVLSIVVILVGGLSAVFSLPRLEDPRIANRYPIIITSVPGASAERVETLRILLEELQRLPAAQRDALTMRFVEGLEPAEIARRATWRRRRTRDPRPGRGPARSGSGQANTRCPRLRPTG